MNYWVRHYKYIIGKLLGRIKDKILSLIHIVLQCLERTYKTIKTNLAKVLSAVSHFIYRYVIVPVLLSTIILPIVISRYLYTFNNTELSEDTILEFHSFIPKVNRVISDSTLELVSDSIFELILNTPGYGLPNAPTKVIENYMDYTFTGDNIENRLLKSSDDVIAEVTDIYRAIQLIWKNNGVSNINITISIIPVDNPELIALYIDQYEITTCLDHQIKDFDKFEN